MYWSFKEGSRNKIQTAVASRRSGNILCNTFYLAAGEAVRRRAYPKRRLEVYTSGDGPE